jgi:hypothetical protein
MSDDNGFNDVLNEITYALSYHPSELLRDASEIKEILRGAAHDSRDFGGDGDTLAAIVRLHDGRVLALEGGSDYTGWDCQSDLIVTAHPSVETAWLDGIGSDSRALIERAEALAADGAESAL